MNLLYLINDLLHYTKFESYDRDLHARWVSSLKIYLPSAVAAAASFPRATHPKLHERLHTLLDIWERNQYLPGAFFKELREAADTAEKSSVTDSDQATRQNQGPKVTKEESFIMPSMHGDSSIKFFDWPAATMIPYIPRESRRPIATSDMRPLQFKPGPADEKLVNAVKGLLKEAERLYDPTCAADSEVEGYDLMGHALVKDPITNNLVPRETYYGWSTGFCEQMNTRKKEHAQRERERERERARELARARERDDPRFRGRERSTSQPRRGRYSSSMSRSRSISRDRSRRSRDYSRSRSRTRSRSRYRSPSHDSRSPRLGHGEPHSSSSQHLGPDSRSPDPRPTFENVQGPAAPFVPAAMSQGFPPPPPPIAGFPYPPPPPPGQGFPPNFHIPPPPPGHNGPWPPPPPPPIPPNLAAQGGFPPFPLPPGMPLQNAGFPGGQNYGGYGGLPQVSGSNGPRNQQGQWNGQQQWNGQGGYGGGRGGWQGHQGRGRGRGGRY